MIDNVSRTSNILDFCEKYPEDILGVYKLGSCVVPFLKDAARDCDYAIIVPDREAFRRMRAHIAYEWELSAGSVFVVINSDELKITPYLWQNEYAEHLYGTAHCRQYEEKFMPHSGEYAAMVRNEYEKFGMDMFHFKHSYLYLVGAYLLLLHGDAFSPEIQIRIRLAHDNGLSAKDLRIIFYVFGLPE